MADVSGQVNDELIKRYQRLAKGGVGLDIGEYTVIFDGSYAYSGPYGRGIGKKAGGSYIDVKTIYSRPVSCE